MPSWPYLSFATEREAERAEQRTAVVVGLGGRNDGDVHPAYRIDLVVVDLREDQLFGDTERVVAAPVELGRRHATEVTDARDRERDEPVVELPHPVAAQRDLGTDLVALTELESRDRLLRLRDERLLPRDDLQVGDGAVEQRLLLGRLAHTHVDHDLHEPRYLHRVRELELGLELRLDLGVVPRPQARPFG